MPSAWAGLIWIDGYSYDRRVWIENVHALLLYIAASEDKHSL